MENGKRYRAMARPGRVVLGSARWGMAWRKGAALESESRLLFLMRLLDSLPNRIVVTVHVAQDALDQPLRANIHRCLVWVVRHKWTFQNETRTH